MTQSGLLGRPLLLIAAVTMVLSLTARSGAAPPNLETLYRFCEESNCTDGATPGSSRLIKDGAGNLYGTTEEGGDNGSGTVFKRKPPGKAAWRRMAG
jgi:uncharacterized repeat protein (TIGR03803 family)